MVKKGLFSKIMALLGTVLVWFPILATIVTSVVFSVSKRVFLFDYLMPAELFPAVLVGGGLLMWAALRVRSRRVLVVCGFIGAIGLLAGTQALAVITGLASGKTKPVGWPWVLTLSSLAGYVLALIVLGIAGLLLLHDLYKRDLAGSVPNTHVT